VCAQSVCVYCVCECVRNKIAKEDRESQKIVCVCIVCVCVCVCVSKKISVDYPQGSFVTSVGHFDRRWGFLL